MIHESLPAAAKKRARALLEPDVLDRLPLAGVGFAGQVRREGSLAVKIAHPSVESRARIDGELRALELLQKKSEPLRVPQLLAVAKDRTAFVRAFIELPSLASLLQAGEPDDQLIELVFAALAHVEAFRRKQKSDLDFSPANIYVDRDRGQIVLADLGRRLAANRLYAKDRAALKVALARHAAWREKRLGPSRVERMIFPPSGRFAVEVDVGRAEKSQLAWLNRGLIARRGIALSEAEIARLGSYGTHVAEKNEQLLSSRYQDTPQFDEKGAKGDGRTVYLGRVPGGSYGHLELQLKGCGPTPLAWIGHAYHEDGFVSFQRTLWETSIADELARLGFETPEMLAVCTNGQTTIDNTDERWPAATAIRVSSTHFRVGHLKLWSRQPRDRGALAAILEHAGRIVHGEDFQVSDPRCLENFLAVFAANLGHDVGKSDALNIHCFHPTLGNVRVDGHFLDYSTVRFFRHYLPDFRFLNNLRRVAGHRLVWRQQIPVLAAIFRDGRLLDEARSRRATAKAFARFDEKYLHGYLEGIFRFFGARELGPLLERRSAVRRFVERAIAFRALRGKSVAEFTFFKQKHPGPLFDLEDRSPELIGAWARGQKDPWRLALAAGESLADLDPRGRKIAAAFTEALSALIPSKEDRLALAPRRFHEVIRPFMEAEKLSDLCYRRTSPENSTRWRRLIATSRHLPEGTYDYFSARELAKKLGHLAFPGLLPNRYEYVIGMSEELYEGVVEILREVLGEKLIGVIVHGSRVMTKDRGAEINPRAFGWTDRGHKAGMCRIREFGPNPRLSSDLDLKVFARPGLDLPPIELELGRLFLDLQARFPLCAYVPPKQRVIESKKRTLDAAFRDYNAGREKGPIPLDQALRFYDPTSPRKDPIAPVLHALARGARLSPHQREMCLRDDPSLAARRARHRK